jgi:branched-chain amino acid transport system permease protein
VTTIWIVQILNGVSLGMLLFILAAGLSLIFGLMKIINLTHGSYFLLGGYIGLSVQRATGSFVLAALCGALAVAIIGALMERFFLRRFHLAEQPQTLLTFGFLFMISDIALTIWGGSTQMLAKPAPLAGAVPLGDVMYPTYRLFLIGFGLAVGIVLWWIQDHTRFGAMVRAGVDNEAIARAMGINVSLLFTVVFSFGAALAALGGVLGGPLIGVYPGADFEVLMLAFVVVIVGGMGSLKGAMVGGVLIGLLDNFGKTFFPEIAMFTLFVPMALVLLIRPTGLFGRA